MNKKISSLWQEMKPCVKEQKQACADIEEFIAAQEWALALEGMMAIADSAHKKHYARKAEEMLRALEKK